MTSDELRATIARVRREASYSDRHGYGRTPVEQADLTAILDAAERAANARNAALEEAAKVVEPTTPCPCDCTEVLDGWHIARCSCQNNGDAEEVASWCSSVNDARRIRALKEPTP